MSKRGVIVDAIQHLAQFIVAPGYDVNDRKTIKAWETLIDALVGESGLGIVVDNFPDFKFGEGGNANSTVGNDMEADGKVSASLTETLLVVDRNVGEGQSSIIPFGSGDSPDTGHHPKAETDAINLDSLTETLLVFDEHCRNDGNNYSCGYLYMAKNRCFKYQADIRQTAFGGSYSPIYFYRCDQCKADFPNGLKLIGER